MRQRTLIAFVACLAVFLALPSLAQEPAEKEFGLLLGAAFPSRDLTGLAQTVDRDSLLLGLRAATALGDRTLLFGDLTGARYNEGVDSDIDINEYALRVGPEFLFGKKVQFFVAPAVGWAMFDPNHGDTFDRGIASIGVGQRFNLKGSDSFRWELRGERAFSGGGDGPEDFDNVAVLLGYTFGKPPRDTDGDGVPDKRDSCPGTPKGAIVDASGCPKDGDGDGVFDGIDRCPDTPKGATVDASGCPKDSDGDGVLDGIDRCPDTPRGATVDASGCPKDSDGDGVLDGIDRCPNTPKGATVDASGCPKDGDGDGVFDGIDRCPDTPKGTKVDAVGCPVAPPIPAVLVLEGVNFESDSGTLLPSSLDVLNRVAASLKAYPDVRVEIAGHTDSTNTTAHNQALSERRAESVRNYLIGQGISASRLTPKGYGEGSPVADNKTKEGRAKNRRVELRKLN